jgi:hypothetical protein
MQPAAGQPAASTSQALHPAGVSVPMCSQPMLMPVTCAAPASVASAVSAAPTVQSQLPQHSMATADGTQQPPQQYYQYFHWPGMPGQPMMMPQGGTMMMPQQVISMPGPGMTGVLQGMPMMQPMGAVPMMQHGQPMQFVHMPPAQDPTMQVLPQTNLQQHHDKSASTCLVAVQ